MTDRINYSSLKISNYNYRWWWQ